MSEWVRERRGPKKKTAGFHVRSPAASTKATQVSYCRSTRIRECLRPLSSRSLTPLTTFYLKFNPKWGPSWQISWIYGIAADFTSTMTTILRSSRLLISKIFCPSRSRFSVLYIRTMHAPRPSLIRFIAASQSENRFTGSWTQYDNSHELNGVLYICNAALREINGYQRCWTLVCCLFMRIHRWNFVNEFPDSNSAWKLGNLFLFMCRLFVSNEDFPEERRRCKIT